MNVETMIARRAFLRRLLRSALLAGGAGVVHVLADGNISPHQEGLGI